MVGFVKTQQYYDDWVVRYVEMDNVLKIWNNYWDKKNYTWIVLAKEDWRPSVRMSYQDIM